MDEQVKNTPQDTNLVHGFSEKTGLITPKLIAIFLGVILLGIGSGYLLARSSTGNGPVSALTSGGTSSSSSITKGTTVGSNDTATFKDTAEGQLKQGGIGGEGQYHLVRPGGDSQNVYLTSSIVDLSKFLDKQVKVWGETQKAQHAGWLMDVGKLQVLN